MYLYTEYYTLYSLHRRLLAQSNLYLLIVFGRNDQSEEPDISVLEPHQRSVEGGRAERDELLLHQPVLLQGGVRGPARQPAPGGQQHTAGRPPPPGLPSLCPHWMVRRIFFL